MKNYLNASASCYADHAEKKMSQLQQAYLRKYQTQQYAYSANVSQRLQDDPGPFGGFGSMRSDDECRLAVNGLNKLRLIRLDYLEEGYDVGDIRYLLMLY